MVVMVVQVDQGRQMGRFLNWEPRTLQESSQGVCKDLLAMSLFELYDGQEADRPHVQTS